MPVQVKWVMEKDVFLDGNPERMAEIITGRDLECRLLRYVEGQPVKSFADGDCAVIYGSMGFVRDMARTRRGIPMAWFNETTLCCHHYYGYWGQYVLQRNYRFMPLGEVQRQKDRLYAELGVDDRIFIRPDDNMKNFAGAALERGRFDHWLAQNVKCYDLLPSLLCLVATPQQIIGEWRVIIAERNVLTASAYIGETRSGTEANVPDRVLSFASSIASAGPFDPFPIYVMDIGETPNGLGLMEIGSLNFASLYACDLGKIVDAASRLAVKSYDERQL